MAILAIAILLALPAKADTESKSADVPIHVQTDLERRQELWINALEWCESRGVISAVNPKDRDNTPSYYSFQFKPSTFRMFGEKYEIIPEGKTDTQIMELMKDHDLQRDIVRRMINDKNVNLKTQFPDCIKNKIGMPPMK